MARFCTSCGTQAAADDRFCAACGTQLQGAEPPPAAPPEPTTPQPPVIPGGSEAAGPEVAAPGRPAPDGHARPPGPDSPRGAGSGGERGRFSRNAVIAIVAAVALAVSGTVAALTLTRTSSPEAVTLQPAGTPGVNPFMPPAGTDQPGPRLVKGSGGTVSGGTPGLYGGTLRKASCNSQQMVSFLRAHPDKAAAWASVLGIRPAGVPGYVAGLTPVVLRSDTAVTNHGYTDGHVTSFPAVLQAGTAVLIDRYGQPVTKCFCGNPLTRPTAYARPAYAGKPWPSFSPASVIYIQQTTIIVNSFTLVDLASGAPFRRPPGSTGSADQPMAIPAVKPGTITTVAGNGTARFCGDGGPATQACLSQPDALAVDAAGNLYIADLINNRVRRVAPDGTITTVAGNGTAGFCGDGGPATHACLNVPAGLAVDAAGNLYIAEEGNRRVRRVAPDGTITTVVGGNVTAGFCGDGGPATQACLDAPAGLAVDAAGNLYIDDSINYRVRRVAPDGTISTVAGNGTQGFCGDGGPATQACFGQSYGLAVDAAGDLYIADWGNERVRRVAPDGTISTVAGNGTQGFCGDGGPATQACLWPQAVLAAAGNLYIADWGNERVRRVAADGTITTVVGNGTYGFCGDGGPATQACLSRPADVALDAAGDLYIADQAGNRVRRFAASTNPSSSSTTKQTPQDFLHEVQSWCHPAIQGSKNPCVISRFYYPTRAQERAWIGQNGGDDTKLDHSVVMMQEGPGDGTASDPVEFILPSSALKEGVTVFEGQLYHATSALAPRKQGDPVKDASSTADGGIEYVNVVRIAFIDPKATG